MNLLPGTLAIALTLLALGAGAAEPGVPLPRIATAPAGQCVEDTEFMRRNHMTLLRHQRDLTVHEGVRTKRHSLANCIDCHVGTEQANAASGEPHFCDSCHAYAAVRPDCFECHARFAEPGAPLKSSAR